MTNIIILVGMFLFFLLLYAICNSPGGKSRKLREPKDGIYRTVLNAKYGGLKYWWTGDKVSTFHFESKRPLTKDDYPELSDIVKKDTGASWAEILGSPWDD